MEFGVLVISPMDEAGARAMVRWRYEPPYDVYNLDPADEGRLVEFFVEPENRYYAIRNEKDDLVAFCCFGRDAQVRGGDYRLPACDIGLGVRPDLTGQGLGSMFVGQALDFAERQHDLDASAFRVTVAGFNRRALSVWQKAGFEPVQVFCREPDAMRFVVLTRTAWNGAAGRVWRHEQVAVGKAQDADPRHRE